MRKSRCSDFFFHMGMVGVTAAMSFLSACATTVSAGSADRSSSVTSGVIPSSANAVFITRVGDELTISWNSEVGMLYTLVTKDKTRRDAEWQPVTGYVDMPGTGRMEKVILRVSSDEPRAFNLKVVPMKPKPRVFR